MTEYTYFIMYHPNIKLNIFYGSFKTIHWCRTFQNT